MADELKRAFGLEGERALITGGGTGLGFAMAKCFVQAGAEVIITGRREDMLKEAVKQLGPKADLSRVRCDGYGERGSLCGDADAGDRPGVYSGQQCGAALQKARAGCDAGRFAERAGCAFDGFFCIDESGCAGHAGTKEGKHSLHFFDVRLSGHDAGNGVFGG